MFIYFAVIDGQELTLSTPLIIFAFIYYVISGLRRLIQFNINSNEGEVEKYFVGVPTPLGAILLWLVYLIFLTGIISETFVLIAMIVIGYLLNSKIKIKHL
jgi:CDP-diacylglycerol--serine O-phosphatidyltransferase